MIDAVVLDIGNVLIGWDPEGFYDRRIGPERRRLLFADVPLHEMNHEIDLGAPFQKTVSDAARGHPDWEQEILLWHDAWIEMTSAGAPRTIEFMRSLRSKGLPVWALTNFGIETLAIADGAYPWLTEFDRRMVSGELGVAKPDAGIYAAVEAQGVPPENLFFVDDRPENIAAADRRGWRTHLYTGPDALAERLVQEGLLAEVETA